MSAIRQGALEIIGKIPKHVIATSSAVERPGILSHVFLVFDDGYHYEFYTLARLGWPHDDRAQRRGANAWVGDGSLVIEARREHIEHRRTPRRA